MTRNQRIMRLHRAGATYGQIVNALRRDFPDLTRSAVAGVVCRTRAPIGTGSIADFARRDGFSWHKARWISEAAAREVRQ